jgi:hypothetical protein
MNYLSNHRSMSRITSLVFALIILLSMSETTAFGYSSGNELLDNDDNEATPVFVDDFNDNTINQNWWDDFDQGGPTVTETNQHLEVDIPPTSSGDAFYAGYTSKFRIRGDFDVEVSYQLPIWPLKNGVRLGIIAGSLGFSPQRVSCGNGEGCVDVYLVNNSGTLSVFLDASSHTEGKFRVTREGDIVTGYYYDSNTSNWVEISSASKGIEDVKFTLQGWSHDSYFIDQDVSVVFDDFTINEGQVIVSEIFVPLVLRK